MLINPNVSRASTDSFVGLARAAASPGTEITGVNGRFGVDLMRRPAELAIGVHAMLDAAATEVDTHDALIVAAFGEYGADAAADLFGKPVLTLARAAFAAVALARCRFAMLVPAPEFAPLMEPLPAEYGVADTCVGIRPVEAAPADPAYAEAAKAALKAVTGDLSPGAVMLVGPPLAAIANDLAHESDVPLVEGVAASVRFAEAITSLGLSGPWPAPPTSARQAEGVGPALARYLLSDA